MAYIRIRGDSKDIEINSIVYENPKIIKQVILPEGEFKKNHITEKKYFSIITIPGNDVEIEIVGSEKNENDEIFYKNYKINNQVFNSDENPTTIMSFESNLSDIYKIKIITQEKTPGNMINPGKTIQKIYHIDYKFDLEIQSMLSDSEVSILKSDFSSNININQTSHDEEEDSNDDEELEEDENSDNEEEEEEVD
jgi:hypothetical protein